MKKLPKKSESERAARDRRLRGALAGGVKVIAVSGAIPAVSPSDVLLVAGEAGCDPRTVRRAVAGLDVRPMVLERIRKVMEKRGIAYLLDGES